MFVGLCVGLYGVLRDHQPYRVPKTKHEIWESSIWWFPNRIPWFQLFVFVHLSRLSTETAFCSEVLSKSWKPRGKWNFAKRLCCQLQVSNIYWHDLSLHSSAFSLCVCVNIYWYIAVYWSWNSYANMKLKPVMFSLGVQAMMLWFLLLPTTLMLRIFLRWISSL